ncbi:MAG: chorismate synthase [Oscillospiraceae bacterium]|nr:chorismate synthase [Oscillospiraceae bacterium]
MKNTFGSSVAVTIFGESHGAAVGAVLDGMAPGVPVDEGFIARQLELRRPYGAISTARREPDAFEIVSGVFEGKTTGTPLCILIRNTDVDSAAYDREAPRPGHADYTAEVKYHGFSDYRGGGHFSGRVTAALVAVGAVALTALRGRGIAVGTHIARCGGVADRAFADLGADLAALAEKRFAVLDDAQGEKMCAAIEAAAAEGDSVGGVLETAVTGLPAGVGEPWFDTLEGQLAHILFSIPAIKGVEFGDGFGFAEARGSACSDALCMENGAVRTASNHNGGINGGISNDMPLLLRCAVKPTPSIRRPQETVNLATGERVHLTLGGRHDPAIVHRARAVVDSAVALALCDALALRFGTDYLAGK